MKILKHKLPVYYNPEYNGLMVVHSRNNKTAIVGNCCHFYNDAYTTIYRYEIPVKMLRKWQRLNKGKLKSYSFIEVHPITQSLCVKDVPTSKEEIDNDYKRCLWYKNEKIISHWLEKITNYYC